MILLVGAVIIQYYIHEGLGFSGQNNHPNPASQDHRDALAILVRYTKPKVPSVRQWNFILTN